MSPRFCLSFLNVWYSITKMQETRKKSVGKIFRKAPINIFNVNLYYFEIFILKNGKCAFILYTTITYGMLLATEEVKLDILPFIAAILGLTVWLGLSLVESVQSPYLSHFKSDLYAIKGKLAYLLCTWEWW